MAELSTRLTIETEYINEEKQKLQESVDFNVEENGKIISLEEVERTHKRSIME